MNKDDIVKTARRRMSAAITGDQDNRERSQDDLNFVTGEGQWKESDKTSREAEGKPCPTVNRMPQFVRQVTGDIRKMNPAINVMAANGEASSETAETIEGLIRHIEYKSDASSVYEQTAEAAAGGSIGWFRVLHDYEDDDSFDQEILIKRIRNSFSVYCDPAAEEPTRSDAGYMFITEQIPIEEFEEQFPKAATIDAEHDSETDGLENWQEDGKVVVAEYYWKEPVTKRIGMLRDGSIIDAPNAAHDVVKTREVRSHKVMWAKISGKEVLEGPKPQIGKNIPVFAVTGEEWHVGEEVYRSSVIRHAKDSQRIYNYMTAASMEMTALQPKAPYLVTAKQVAGLETFWNEANSKNRPYLPYNPDEKAPRPERVSPPIPSQAIMAELQKADMDMKATTGIYDAGLGNRSNENSGVAIRQRQMESDVATSIYSDNMAKAIAQCGRVIIEMIPEIYDTRRIIRILGKDGTEKMVPVNDLQITQDGVLPVNDFKVGKYDVRVNVGPNYSTIRQETAEGMMSFVQAIPQAGAITADLIAKAQDWPDADQFAERLKKALPPNFQDAEDLSPEEQQAAMQAQQQQQVQAQMQAAAQQIDMRKADAEATEAEADAQKAQFEVMNEQLELAAKSGQLDAAIGQIVQQEVARALQSVIGGFPQ